MEQPGTLYFRPRATVARLPDGASGMPSLHARWPGSRGLATALAGFVPVRGSDQPAPRVVDGCTRRWARPRPATTAPGPSSRPRVAPVASAAPGTGGS